jgi:hypothetical protein
MADTGAPWNIPYVEPSDLVRDYPAASEALGTAIAAGLTSAAVIRQVVSSTKTDTFSASVATTARSGAAIAVTITPTSNTSKIFFVASLSLATAGTGIVISSELFADGSQVTGYIGDGAGSRQRRSTAATDTEFGLQPTVLTFLHSPSTSNAITYDVRLSHNSGSTQTVYLNRSRGDTDTVNGIRGASTLTAIEVAA